ncbi:MAG: efflux transporter outer membrane subunit [Deltaproteobacteria bacterium]|nr:efflux transporter outer membrane subunit [Candidatus Anaeroferrophillacea bacterium]
MTTHTDRLQLTVLLLVVLGGFLTGCTLHREALSGLPLELPKRFSIAGTEAVPERWWEAFAEPELDILVAAAVTDNFSLRAAADRLRQAAAVARRERGGLYPAVDVDAGAARGVSRNGTLHNTTYTTELSLGLAAGYEIDLWNRIGATAQAAEEEYRAARDDWQAAAIGLAAETTDTWFALASANARLELLRRQLETNLEVLEVVTMRFRRGRTGAADVLQQRQLAESRRGEIALARAEIAVYRQQLAILAGRTPQSPPFAGVSRFDPMLPPLPDTGLPAELVIRRPDIRAAHRRLLAADRRAAAAVAERFPRLTIGAVLSTDGVRVGDLFENWLGRLAADLTAPLFDAGTRQAEAERAFAVVDERLHGYGQTVLEALAEVEGALAREERQRQHIASLQRQLDHADRVAGLLRDTYVRGAVDYLRVLDALLTQQGLEQHLVAARQQLVSYRIALYRALAGGITN